MKPLINSVDLNRSPEVVFDYLVDLKDRMTDTEDASEFYNEIKAYREQLPSLIPRDCIEQAGLIPVEEEVKVDGQVVAVSAVIIGPAELSPAAHL